MATKPSTEVKVSAMKVTGPSPARRSYRLRFSLALTLAAATATACKPAPNTSDVENIACIGTWLTSFIDAIPLPGFAALSKVVNYTASSVAGALKNSAKSATPGCGSPATFSDEQMKQMKQAIKEGFNEQNHMEATALMRKIETKFNEFVPDKERFTPYTITALQSIIDDANDWLSKYDQSGSKIYNVHDFVIVTGYTMQAYQHQIREVALEANNTRSSGDAQKVREYAKVLSDKAHWTRVNLEGMSNNDVKSVAKSFWKNNAEQQTKKYMARDMLHAHCYESADGNAYATLSSHESRETRRQNFLNMVRGTKTLQELSDVASKNGTVCCDDGQCQDLVIEKWIAEYIDVTAQQVKKVIFDNSAEISKYYGQTLPMFIDIAGKIRQADDAAIFSLASANGEVTAATPASTAQQKVATEAGNTCPNGRGYGDVYTCGDKQCAKAHDRWNENPPECVVTP